MKQFRTLFRNRRFVRLWLAGAISNVGDYINSLALVKVLAADPSHLGLYMSLIMVAKVLPGLVLGPVAGVVADRFSRKAIMVISDLLRVGLVAGLVWATSPTAILTLVTLAAVVSVFFNPAAGAVLPEIAGTENLVTAGSLQVMTNRMAMLLGNGLGAFLLALMGVHNVFFLDAASFLFSALMLLTIAIPRVAAPAREEPAKGIRGHFIADLKEWLGFMKESPAVRHLLTAFGIAGLGDSGVNILLIPFFTVGLGLAAEKLGYVLAALGASAVVGALAVGALGKKVHWRHLVTLGGIYVWVTATGTIVAHQVVVSTAFLVLLGLGSGMINVGAQAATGTLVPDHLRGRIFAGWGMVAGLITIAGTLVAGPLADLFGSSNVLLAFSSCYLLAGLYSGWAFRGLKSTAPTSASAD